MELNIILLNQFKDMLAIIKVHKIMLSFTNNFKNVLENLIMYMENALLIQLIIV